MYTKRQIELMRALLLNWGNDETISALSLEAEKLTTLSNCLNYLLISNNLLSSDECFNRITLAKTAMEDRKLAQIFLLIIIQTKKV